MQIATLPVADIEVPRDVSRLYELAYNLWWSWTPRAARLFSSIDSLAWSHYRNPVELLINIDPARWESLLRSEEFMAAYDAVINEFDRYMKEEGRCWYHRGDGDRGKGPIAYFCMEFGVHECLQGYSGGLGILAGDHLKGASDLCVPVVGVGMLYKRGYFRQAVDADGRQQHMYPMLDFSRLPLRPAAGPTGQEVIVSVEMPGREVHARVWVAQVGRVPLLLLDTDIARNDPADRPISGILYVRGRGMRLVQEFLLGVGGARALEALGIDPTVWHLNEGHSGFLQVERLRKLTTGGSATVEEALRTIIASTVFTTHTPVPAGNETFDRNEVRRYIEALVPGSSEVHERILRLGEGGDGNPHTPFNMTAFVLKTSRFANGVSALHARVSNGMWAHALRDGGERVIHCVNNGVHTQTWLGTPMLELLNRALGQDWKENLFAAEGWDLIKGIEDGDLWEAHQAQKEHLARFVRWTLLGQFARHGRSPEALRELQTWFSPAALTIGFARRFATYKRAHLLFSDLDRLGKLVSSAERPVQIVVAGKAHPADRAGQDLIQYIFGLSQSEGLRGKVFFLENYDMHVARAMLQGTDVWLNTPRRPQEASGTSGMKAGLNGVLNLSVADGWWPEGFSGDNGWVIGHDADSKGDEAAQDRADADSLYATLQDQIVPVYYERGEGGVPARWVRMMKSSIAMIMPRFSAQSMAKNYAERAYFSAER